MKSISSVLAVSLALGCPAVSAVVAGPANDRDAIQAKLNLTNRALINKDLKGLMSCCTSDYTSKDTAGEVTTRADVQKEAQHLFEFVTFSKI